MKRIIALSALAMCVTHANALDLGTLKDAIKSTGSSTSTTSTTSSSTGVSSLSNEETSGGLKEALTQGVGKAVATLGAADGFFGNKEVKIPLPKSLKKIEKGMKLMGMGKQSDELILKMNRAAEAAVPEAKALLVGSIKQMTLADAKTILTGPQDAATQYFKKTTSVQMGEKFLPIVTKATENVQLAASYNKYAEMGSKFGVVKKEDANIEQYVTNKALDGVYFMIAKEEAAIRKDPLGQASSLLKKVFGALGK
jgi:DNA polymerase III sliding clamp (beta) subunit (PCNA family)